MIAKRDGAGAVMAAAVAAGILLACTTVAPLPAKAADPMPKEEVVARIAETYGVEVLRTDDVAVDDRAAYAITVMNPGGDFNAAFQVYTLLVDAETGALIPMSRYRAAGHDRPGAASYDREVDGMAMRRRSFGQQ